MKTIFGLVLLVVSLSLASVGPAFATGSFGIDSNCPDGTYPVNCGPVKVTVTSINGFSGTVNLSTSVSPSCAPGNCLNATVTPSSVTVPPSATAAVTFTHSCNFHQFTRCEWTVTITGKSGSLTNSTGVFVCYGTNCPI